MTMEDGKHGKLVLRCISYDYIDVMIVNDIQWEIKWFLMELQKVTAILKAIWGIVKCYLQWM